MANVRYPLREARQNIEALHTAGDQLQSEASRLAEWVRNNVPFESLPYEVGGALHGVESAVDLWTVARRA